MRIDRDKVVALARAAYQWGMDNGVGRSDKNFIDFKETTIFKEFTEEKPLLEGEYFMVKEEENNETFVPALVYFNSIEQEKYFKFFNGSEIPCRLAFQYYSI